MAKKLKLEPYVPTENEAQKIVVRWAWGDSKSFGANAKWPDLNWLYMIPNGAMLGGYNRHATYQHLRAMGLNPGVPDFVLPSARAGAFGAYLEGKRSEDEKLASKQEKWRDYLIAAGYWWRRWDGDAECIDLLTWYLKQPRTVVIPFLSEEEKKS